MSVNDSSSTNESVPSQVFYPFQCFYSFSDYIFIASTFTNILLLLPLSVFVLHLGFQRWKQQLSISSAAVNSLSDFVTYNMAVMELIGMVGDVFVTLGGYAGLPVIIHVGMLFRALPWYGQILFPILSCMERYLAVVHPITYLIMKQGDGVRIRNLSTAYVWLHCFAGMGCLFLIEKYPKFTLIPSACQMAFFLIAMIFCSLSILCVLIRPRPGEARRDRARVDQSKRKAFHAIMLIMGVLFLRFGWSLVSNVVGLSQTLSFSTKCVMITSSGWFNLPSSLVLPLLFLHHAGKLPGCKHNTGSG